MSHNEATGSPGLDASEALGKLTGNAAAFEAIAAKRRALIRECGDYLRKRGLAEAHSRDSAELLVVIGENTVFSGSDVRTAWAVKFLRIGNPVSSLDIRDPREVHLIDSGSNDKLHSALAGALARLPSRQGSGTSPVRQ